MRSQFTAKRAAFDDSLTETQTATVLRWVHRYLGEVRYAETGELHVNHLESLFFPLTEALFHGRDRTLFLSDQPWPERAVFRCGSLVEILPVRTLAEKTLFLVRALDRLRVQLGEEARLVEPLIQYLERILPERERPAARLPRPRAVGF